MEEIVVMALEVIFSVIGLFVVIFGTLVPLVVVARDACVSGAGCSGPKIPGTLSIGASGPIGSGSGDALSCMSAVKLSSFTVTLSKCDIVVVMLLFSSDAGISE